MQHVAFITLKGKKHVPIKYHFNYGLQLKISFWVMALSKIRFPSSLPLSLVNSHLFLASYFMYVCIYYIHIFFNNGKLKLIFNVKWSLWIIFWVSDFKF